MARWVGSMVAGATLAVSVLVGVPGSAGGAEPPDTTTPDTTTPESCPTPYEPLAYAQSYPAQEALPEVDGTDVAQVWPPDLESVDTDGDGVADTISVSGAGTPDARLVLGRGDGEVILSVPDAEAIGVTRTGDIDGDGRDEATVYVADSSDDGAGTFLLPGTTAPGTAPLAEAAILLTDVHMGTAMAPDTSDRLLLTDFPSRAPGSTTIVHDGGDVLALGAGGDATEVEPEATYAGQLVATTATSAGAPVTTLVMATVFSGPPEVGGTAEVRLVVVEGDGDVHELTTRPEPVASADPGPSIGVIEGADGTFIVLSMASRSGASAHMWWLDDPCGELPDAEVDPEDDDDPPSAPPAQPVTAPADFTG